MDNIAASRKHLIDALSVVTGPRRTGSTFPSPLSFPCAIVGHGDPWVEPLTWGESTVRWSVLLVVRPGAGDVMIDALDRLVTDALSALADVGLPAIVQSPEIVTVDGQQQSGLACRLTITTTILTTT